MISPATAASDGPAAVASRDGEVIGHDAIPSGHCRNCGAPAPRRYCPDCGQTTVLHPPSVGEFVHEFLGHHVAIEGPLWRTLHALLLTPGRLTVEYFAGRRQRYIPPLRLYLTFSLILFTISSLQGEGLKLGDQKIEIRMPKDAETGKVIAPPIEARPDSDSFMGRAALRVAALTREQRDGRINAAVRQYLPYVLIALVPMLALLMKLIYWNRRLLYGEHLIVAFHAQTVAFIFSIVSALPLGEVIGAIWIPVLIAHGAIALRRVYGGRWLTTVCREALLLLIYSVLIGLAMAALAIVALVF